MNQIPGKTRCNRKTYDRIFLSKMAMRLYEQRERMNILDSLFSLRRCDEVYYKDWQFDFVQCFQDFFY